MKLVDAGPVRERRSRVGVLALQGAFARHAAALESLGHQAVLVRTESDFGGLDGLVLPGGESSVQLEMLRRLALCDVVERVVRAGCPVLATCAGAILCARDVASPAQASFGFVDIAVTRNGWGRQSESFEAESDAARKVVFIRAPRIVLCGRQVEVLDRFRGEPILVRQRNVTCATFHPELTSDVSLHADVFGTAHARARAPGACARAQGAP